MVKSQNRAFHIRGASQLEELEQSGPLYTSVILSRMDTIAIIYPQIHVESLYLSWSGRWLLVASQRY